MSVTTIQSAKIAIRFVQVRIFVRKNDNRSTLNIFVETSQVLDNAKIIHDVKITGQMKNYFASFETFEN